MKIHLHIERLVLEGLPIEQPHLLRRALETDLAGRLREGGISPELHTERSTARVAGGDLKVERRPDPSRLGTQIASAVYRGIGARK